MLNHHDPIHESEYTWNIVPIRVKVNKMYVECLKTRYHVAVTMNHAMADHSRLQHGSWRYICNFTSNILLVYRQNAHIYP